MLLRLVVVRVTHQRIWFCGLEARQHALGGTFWLAEPAVFSSHETQRSMEKPASKLEGAPSNQRASTPTASRASPACRHRLRCSRSGPTGSVLPCTCRAARPIVWIKAPVERRKPSLWPKGRATLHRNRPKHGSSQPNSDRCGHHKLYAGYRGDRWYQVERRWARGIAPHVWERSSVVG